MLRPFIVFMLVESVLAVRNIIDLSHTLDKNAPKIPLDSFGFTQNITWYENVLLLAKEYPDREMWLELRRVEFYEHQGTHIDAPNHFGRGRQAMHEIPPERLIGPGVIIDVREQAKANPDYAVTVDDIRAYEETYGQIPTGAIVIMNSGWSEKYPNQELTFGSTNFSDFSTFHYPGWSIAACRFLNEERMISVLGVDTTSTDPNQVGYLDFHRYLQPLNVPLLEYVGNLHNCPPNGTTIFLGVPKIRDGTGAPTRIFAVIDDVTPSDNASDVTYCNIAITSIVLYLSFLVNKIL